MTSSTNTRGFDEVDKAAHANRIQLWSDGFYRTPKIHDDKVTLTGRPFFYFAHGAACSEVAIDTLSGERCVLKIDILHDVGTSINPAIDIGQIEGRFMQGMGWLTTEQLVWTARAASRPTRPAPTRPRRPATSPRTSTSCFATSPIRKTTCSAARLWASGPSCWRSASRKPCGRRWRSRKDSRCCCRHLPLRRMCCGHRVQRGAATHTCDAAGRTHQNDSQVPLNPCCSTPGTAQLQTPAGKMAFSRCCCAAVKLGV